MNQTRGYQHLKLRQEDKHLNIMYLKKVKCLPLQECLLDLKRKLGVWVDNVVEYLIQISKYIFIKNKHQKFFV